MEQKEDEKQRLAWTLSHIFRAPVCTLEGLIVSVIEPQGLLAPEYIAMFKIQFVKWYKAIDTLTALLLLGEEHRKLKWMELLVELSIISESLQELRIMIEKQNAQASSEKISVLLMQVNFISTQVKAEVDLNNDLIYTRNYDNI